MRAQTAERFSERQYRQHRVGLEDVLIGGCSPRKVERKVGDQIWVVLTIPCETSGLFPAVCGEANGSLVHARTARSQPARAAAHAGRGRAATCPGLDGRRMGGSI